MNRKPKPDWWPQNPYPEDIFPMTRPEYAHVVPEPHTRTALSGMLGREFWGIASDAIWDAFVALTNYDEEAKPIEPEEDGAP